LHKLGIFGLLLRTSELKWKNEFQQSVFVVYGLHILYYQPVGFL